MLAFTLRRAIQAIGVMIAVGIIAFSMFRFAGDPVNQIVSLDTPAAEREAVRKSLGLDDPVLLQFARYFGNAAQFKFGVSYQFRQPVSNLLMERLPATMELAICATLFSMVFGILMGVYSALRRDTLLAKIFQAVSLIGISLPTFLIGILLIYLFAVTLGWLPSFGRGEVVRLGWWTTGLLTLSGLKALIMPSITLGLFQMTLIMRLVRAEMPRPDHAGGQFRPCSQEHAGSGHHRGRPAIWLGYCIFDHHRNRLPVARHGVVVRTGDPERRYPDHGRVPADDFADLRHDQSGGGYPLHRRRSAFARDH